MISFLFIVISVFFAFQQKPFLKGISYAVIPFSILLLIICLGIISRTPKDIKRVSALQMEKPHRVPLVELPRMEKVMKNFNIIKKVELAVFIIGLLLLVLFWPNEIVRGVAIGLLVMGASLYTFDYFAESRGETYMQFLQSL
jgi:hypothetical protein